MSSNFFKNEIVGNDDLREYIGKRTMGLIMRELDKIFKRK